jgi:hypothetical protein
MINYLAVNWNDERGMGPYGFIIEYSNLSVTPVPEASAVAMWLLVFASLRLASLLRRRTPKLLDDYGSMQDDHHGNHRSPDPVADVLGGLQGAGVGRAATNHWPTSWPRTFAGERTMPRRHLLTFALVAFAIVAPATAAPPEQPWFAKAPPLPKPVGPVTEVATVEELLDAAENARPGETILIADGRYKLPAVLALATDRLTLRSHSGNRHGVVLDGAESRHGEPVLIRGQSVTVADLTIQNIRWNGFKIASELGAQRATIYNCVNAAERLPLVSHDLDHQPRLDRPDNGAGQISLRPMCPTHALGDERGSLS